MTDTLYCNAVWLTLLYQVECWSSWLEVGLWMCPRGLIMTVDQNVDKKRTRPSSISLLITWSKDLGTVSWDYVIPTAAATRLIHFWYKVILLGRALTECPRWHTVQYELTEAPESLLQKGVTQINKSDHGSTVLYGINVRVSVRDDDDMTQWSARTALSLGVFCCTQTLP